MTFMTCVSIPRSTTLSMNAYRSSHIGLELSIHLTQMSWQSDAPHSLTNDTWRSVEKDKEYVVLVIHFFQYWIQLFR
jgi:hypothetical protein